MILITGGGGIQRGLTSRIDRVNVSPSLQEGHHDGVQGKKVGYYLGIGHYKVEGSILCSVNCLRISPCL